MQLKTAAAIVLLIIAIVVMVALGYLHGPFMVLLIMVLAIAVVWPLVSIFVLSSAYRRQDREEHY